jgi:hypothetical protein
MQSNKLGAIDVKNKISVVCIQEQIHDPTIDVSAQFQATICPNSQE